MDRKWPSLPKPQVKPRDHSCDCKVGSAPQSHGSGSSPNPNPEQLAVYTPHLPVPIPPTKIIIVEIEIIYMTIPYDMLPC